MDQEEKLMERGFPSLFRIMGRIVLMLRDRKSRKVTFMHPVFPERLRIPVPSLRYMRLIN